MAQGQPGRPPPGHAWRAPRHFVRDAVVFEDYTIAEGRVIPQGAPRTRYHPETCPALPQQLARLARGDTSAVLAFVRTYGLFIGKYLSCHSKLDCVIIFKAGFETQLRASPLSISFGMSALGMARQIREGRLQGGIQPDHVSTLQGLDEVA
jgi:hypothetical protein